MDNLSPSSPETILVVDDNETVLQVVVMALENANFRVLSATSGTKAIEVAEQTSGAIDLLLSDVDMPVMSGCDLAHVLMRARPAIHVMLMSGGDNRGVLVEDPGWAYIQKPFVPVKLVDVVSDFLHAPQEA